MTHLNAAKLCVCVVNFLRDIKRLNPFSPYLKNKKLVFDLFLVVVNDSVFPLCEELRDKL